MNMERTAYDVASVCVLELVNMLNTFPWSFQDLL